MSRYHSYLNTAVSILSGYNGDVPFASVLKKFFTDNKKHGSRDRKEIAALCYAYFRTARLFEGDTMEEKVLKGFFLCSTGPNELLQQCCPAWNEKAPTGVEEKCSMFNDQCSMLNLFPWKDELSDGIDMEEFAASFLVQPDLFLRVRPGQLQTVEKKLKDAGIPYRVIGESCLVLPITSRVDQVITLNKEAVVQDLSSQRVGELFTHLKPETLNLKPSVWDCCAASGGKSILATDLLGDIDLTVSDIRESILHNLKKRFKEAGIKNYKSFVADLTNPSGKNEMTHRRHHEPTPDSRLPTPDSRLPTPDSRLPTPNSRLRTPDSELPTPNSQDLLIADLPCTGSGTWSRTPEQLFYFKREKIGEYASLQKKILSTILPALKPGGHLLYITCSVFKKENEEQISYLKEKFHLQTVKMELFRGYAEKADTMFAALLVKPLKAD